MALGKRLEATVIDEMAQTPGAHPLLLAEKCQADVADIILAIKKLLARIDSDIPLLQLAITASGESLSSGLPPGISPSRMLQASMLIVVGDTQFASQPTRPVQIGPSFTLSVYMLFRGHTTHSTSGDQPTTKTTGHNHTPNSKSSKKPYGLGDGERRPIWQEVLHKARVRICRVPRHCVSRPKQGFTATAGSVSADTEPDFDGRASYTADRPSHREEYAYHLEIIEDLDDGRVHDEDEGQGQDAEPMPYENTQRAGIRESIPIHQFSKIFYTDTGQILNIGTANDSENKSVLLLKRDAKVVAPSYTMSHMMPGHEEEDDAGSSDDQDAIDRQLHAENIEIQRHQNDHRWHFPPYLDPEWLALEVFAEEGVGQNDGDPDGDPDGDDGDDDGDNLDDEDKESDGDSSLAGAALLASSLAGASSSRDSPQIPSNADLAEDMQSLSLAPVSLERCYSSVDSGGSAVEDSSKQPPDQNTPHSGQLPFGVKVTSSLSLLEMLVRFTSLQVFQQTSHLSIPDHILAFFLEETSTTTGLRSSSVSSLW